MLIVTGTFEVDPEERDAFLQSRIEAMRTSRSEDGCLDYVFAADPLVPGRVVLVEQWESEEALAAHIAAMQAARAAAPPKPADAPPRIKVTSSSITKHVVASSAPLG
jgi:quinol monooxygenase YgiN